MPRQDALLGLKKWKNIAMESMEVTFATRYTIIIIIISIISSIIIIIINKWIMFIHVP